MVPVPIKQQLHATPIQVAGWSIDEDFGVYPLGAKPKRLLICPQACEDPALIPGHRYLFKTAYGWRRQQMWSELIAYFVGCRLGLSVPPCFIAEDARVGEAGILVEYFLNYPDETKRARLVHGADLVQNLRMRPITQAEAMGDDVPQFLRSNIRMCAALGVPDSSGWWAACLAFDAMIGNVDRHTQNWGLLTRGIHQDGSLEVDFAPIFDNGTSLGYEVLDQAIQAQWSPKRIARYIAKGSHHSGWSTAFPGRIAHPRLCRMLGQVDERARALMVEMTRVNLDAVIDLLTACTHFDTEVRFSAGRATFVRLLLEARRSELSGALERVA